MPPTRTDAPTATDVDADIIPATPQPTAPTGPAAPDPAVPTGIPDGPPSEAALALLNSLKPDAPSILAGRIEALTRQLDDQVEEYRLNLKGSFGDFIQHAGRRVKLKRKLQERAGQPAVGSAAAEVLGLIRSIKRFRPCEELKAQRAQRIASARAELARVEAGVEGLGGAVKAGNGIGHPDLAQQAAGFSHEHDAILHRLEGLLRSRKALVDRLAKLDAQGDPRRGELVKQAIEANGGAGAVVAQLTAAMPAPSQAALDKLKADIDATAGRLDAIDGESRLAGDLRAALQALTDKLPGLQFRVAGDRKAAASELVKDAVTGSLVAVRALLSAVGPQLPALAEALEAIRGDDSDLVAVVEELIS